MRFGTYLGRRNCMPTYSSKNTQQKTAMCFFCKCLAFSKGKLRTHRKKYSYHSLLAWPQENVLYLSTNNAECGGKRLFQSSDFRAFSSAILETKKTLGTRLEIDVFSLYVLFSQQRSQGNLTLCLFINSAYIHMHVNKTKFERNNSLEYYHMTCIGKTKHTS